MLEHQNPFDVPSARGADLLAEEQDFRVSTSSTGFLLLQSSAETALREALTGEIGLDLPEAQHSCARGRYALLWLSPAEWLVELPAHESDSLHSAFVRRLAPSLAVVTDMSDAFACCEVSGARAAQALSSGCRLDLRTHAFPVGRTARTALAEVPAIIWHCRRPGHFRCMVERSFAAHVHAWLLDVAGGRRAAPAAW